MVESSWIREGVNAPSEAAAVRLARWQGAVAVVLGPYERAGLALTDGRASEAYAELAAGRWLAALLWLGEGPVVDRRAALADPLGSLLASVVLRVVEPIAHALATGRASPFWRAVVAAYVEACVRRPVRDPMAWLVEVLLRAGGDVDDLERAEAAAGERLDPDRVAELVVMAERDWEAEALSRALGGMEGP